MSAGIFTCTRAFNQVNSCYQSPSVNYVSLSGCPHLFYLIHCQPGMASFVNLAILSITLPNVHKDLIIAELKP